MLQQPTRPLLLVERTLHVRMVQLFGSLTIPYTVKNQSQIIKFIKKSQTIILYISNSAFWNLHIKVITKYDWHLYLNLWKHYVQGKLKLIQVKLTAQMYIKQILIWEHFSQLTKTMKFLLKIAQSQNPETFPHTAILSPNNNNIKKTCKLFHLYLIQVLNT